MFKIYNKKFGFTLVEVLVVCSLIAFMTVGIIFAINNAFIFIDSTKLAISATNLARGGVEMVYNIRDTNRRKYSGEKDKYWGSGLDEGIYVIEDNGSGLLNMNRLEGIDIDDFYSIEGFFSGGYSTGRNKSKLNFTGTYSYYTGGNIETGNIADLLGANGSEFYRIVRVYGKYCKLGTGNDQRVDSDHCKNISDPKELRFCVKVFYENQGHHASELCSIMTNFME